MFLSGMLWGSKILRYIGFPCSEILGPEADQNEIRALLDKWGTVFVKPIFKGPVGGKGRAGLIGRATTLEEAMREKERLYFVEHTNEHGVHKAEGVTFEGAIPSKHEIYFSLSDNTRFRAPTVTITDAGGVNIEELPRERIQVIPFDALSGFKGFVVSNAMRALNAPPKIISPLVQNLPLLWELYHSYGMTLLEINPIRMMPEGNRLVPVACDFKCAFDINDSNWKRLSLPPRVFASSYSHFEQEINRLRTYQGQSDVFVINPHGTVTPMTFGGGANALVTELLGDCATISTDFGGNPPYEKMRQVAEICYSHWLPQSNVLFIVGGKANNTDIFETFRAMSDALRSHFAKHGPSPLFVIALRGGPRVVQGMAYLRDTLDALDIPHRMLGFTSSMGEVVDYVKRLDDWMIREGRAMIAERMGVSPIPSKSKHAPELVPPSPDSRILV